MKFPLGIGQLFCCLAPLVAELAASREMIARQAETIGQLRAENQHLLASTATNTHEPTVEPFARVWRSPRVVSGAAVVLVALVVLVTIVAR